MSDDANALAVALFSELLTVDQLVRNRLTKIMPKGMEISHFSVLNHLAVHSEERTPAQLAQTFQVTRGAMTNTLAKLEWAGYVHIRPDWDDARRKMISISPAGRKAREMAVELLAPMINEVVLDLGVDKVRGVLPLLRQMRTKLGTPE